MLPSFDELYAAQVDHALRDGACEFKIDSSNYAIILISKLIEKAEKEIIIRSHRLAREIYGDDMMINALKKAYKLHPDLKCSVYLRDTAPDLTPFVSTLLDHDAKIETDYKSDDESNEIVMVDGRNGRVEP